MADDLVIIPLANVEFGLEVALLHLLLQSLDALLPHQLLPFLPLSHVEPVEHLPLLIPWIMPP
jgi:hypothetical protein